MFGLKASDFDHEVVEVWPENVESLDLFIALRTQWRTGMNGPTGLDYTAVLDLIRFLAPGPDKARDLFADMQVMESAALEQIAEDNKEPSSK